MARHPRRSRLERVNDSTSLTRLDLLRFLERVQKRDLARTRRWIAEEEARAVQQERRQETEERVAPDWILQTMINSGASMLHLGTCWATGSKRTRGITRDEALDALAHGAEACSVCRPDTALGVLD